jgi:RND family efflux transporter MFP subunit
MVELMTENTPEQDRPTPAELARQQWRASGGARRAWVAFVIVALISLVVGAGGVLVALRYGWVPMLGGGPGHETGATAAPAQAASPSAAQESMAGMPGMGSATAARPGDASDKAVYISPARQQLIGVRTAPVTDQALDTTIRTVGVLAFDETRVTQVNTKIAGWVERVYVDYVGKPVRRGQPLFSVYSPELVATQNEYLLALRAQAQLGSSQVTETRTSAASLLAATRERLKLWDISDAQVAELERTRQPRKSLILYAPFDGIVLERNAFAGQYITPEMATFKLADLSTIWVVAQVFEYELRSVRIGQEVDIQFPYGEYGRTIKGHISFIYPDIDPQTRRARIRIEFPNPGFQFKPGSYVTVALKTGGSHSLALPKEAVIDTGAKQYAILALPNGYFDPREVTVGQPNDQYYPVVSGVKEGDQVVTSAQFLVDSEANLQEAMKAMSMSMPGMDMGGDDTKGTGVGDKKGKPQTQPAPKQPGMENMPGMEKPPPKQPPAKPKKQGGHDQGGMESMPGMDDMPGMNMRGTQPKPAPKKSSNPKGRGGTTDRAPTPRGDSKEPGL